MSTLYFVMGLLFAFGTVAAVEQPGGAGVGALAGGLFIAAAICHIEEQRRRYAEEQRQRHGLQDRLDELKRGHDKVGVDS